MICATHQLVQAVPAQVSHVDLAGSAIQPDRTAGSQRSVPTHWPFLYRLAQQTNPRQTILSQLRFAHADLEGGAIQPERMAASQWAALDAAGLSKQQKAALLEAYFGAVGGVAAAQREVGALQRQLQQARAGEDDELPAHFVCSWACLYVCCWSCRPLLASLRAKFKSAPSVWQEGVR